MAEAKKVLKVLLRNDQTISQVESGEFNDDNVCLFAPIWLRKCLEELSQHIPSGTVFQFTDSMGNTKDRVLNGNLKPKDLVTIARNEHVNVTGVIDFSLYAQVTEDKRVIYAIKDLVRQCIIISPDRTTHFGGYGETVYTEQEAKVFLIDLIGLQFQKDYNTGRLVLIGPGVPRGLSDDQIFESVVGQRKEPLRQVQKNRSGRYVKQGNVYFDTLAYERFVEQDFLLVCLSLNSMEDKSEDNDLKNLNLKFLRYGTGFFAGPYTQILNKHIIQGILRGMKRLFESDIEYVVKSFEFPFYERNQEIIDLCAVHSVKCSFTREDALKQSDPKVVTATTNCADPHAMAGNEMGFSSVDAAIAQNLVSKAHKFSPILNRKMRSYYVDMDQIDKEVEQPAKRKKDT